MDHGEEPWLVRPTAAELRQEFKAAFLPSGQVASLSDLTGRAVSKAGLGIADDLDGGVLLRSVYWRIYLQTLPLASLDSLSTAATSLRESREVYDVKRSKYLRAPDGRWAEDCTRPEGSLDDLPGNGQSPESGGDAWDPLSLGEANPWQDWFAAQELRATIMKDVERTFPDIPYFRSPIIRRALLTILFLWSTEHPDVGYRQGMHELAAVLLMVVDRDSIAGRRQDADQSAMYSPLMGAADEDENAGGSSDSLIDRVLDRASVEHDAYALFVQVMHAAKGWYEWRAEASPQAHRTGGPQDKAKIVEMCNRLQNETIRRVDPVLGGRMEAEGVEGQIWAIRYIRLLFTREMPLASALRIWDGLFAVDPALEHLVETVCIALVLRIRNLLIPADYSTMLTALLRYPPSSPELPLSPQLILSQALRLRDNPNPAGGAAVTLQNQEILGISAVAEEPVEEVERPRRQPPRRAPAHAPGSPRIGPTAQGRNLEGLAKGLMERAQAAGLDKAILSTVSEFRKNLPEFSSPQASNFSFRTFSPPPSDFSSIPDMEAALPRPPPRTLRDADREIAELRLVMIGMGKAMNRWMVDVQPREAPAEGPAQAAWTGLGRLQHSLLDCGVVSTSDLARDWAWSNDLESRAATPSVPASADSMSNSVQSIASDTVLLNKPSGIQDDGRPTTAAAVQQAGPSAPRAHIHPPLTTSFASMMNGTSPRQFAFPSPFSSLASSDAGRRASPIPPPERDHRASPTRPDLAARLAAAAAKPPDPLAPARYPPTSPETVDPLKGTAVRSTTTVRRKDVDPLLGADL